MLRAWSLKISVLLMRLRGSGSVKPILSLRLQIFCKITWYVLKDLVTEALLTVPKLRSAIASINGETISVVSKFVASIISSKPVPCTDLIV